MSKRGRLSLEEQKYIRDHALTKTPEEIATHLNRTADMVRDFVSKNVPQPGKPNDAVKVAVRQELRSSMAWRQLNDELTSDELKYFEERFVLLMSQFKDDVLPTEETQVFLLIKFEVLMNRNMKERRRSREDIERLITAQKAHIKQAGGMSKMNEEEKTFMLAIETQLQSAKAAEQNRTTEFVKLEEKHQALMKDLKATRDQRISKIEGSKQSFVGLLKILQEKDIRDAEGRQMELMKLATTKEHKRLGQVMTYEDNNQDQPILSAETVEMLDEGEEEDDS